MHITFNEIQNIFKTLPIGYYLKRNIKHVLDNSAASYFDPMNDEIHVGYETIAKSLESLPNDTNAEESVRACLYHEVSHAILTPKALYPTRQINIFEDERIESILKTYYANVDFKDFCFRFNNFHGQAPTSADDLFYQIVRFRKGPQEFVDRVHDIILQNRTLNFNSTSTYVYTTMINTLYEDVEKYWNDQQQNSSNNEQKSEQSNDADTNDSNDSKNSDEFTKPDTQNDIDTNNANENTSDNSENGSIETYELNDKANDQLNIEEQDVDKIIDSAMKTLRNSKMINDINQILAKINASTKRNGSAINAYSGRFDIRSVTRNDYKYFVQQNRLGNVKQFSVLHLNLFIDTSGSFWESENTVNELIYALTKFEQSNSNFEFDVITCGRGQTILDKSNRTIHCSGSNRLDENIFDQFKSLQKANRQNVNLVLFDGDAFSGYHGYEKRMSYKNFAAFNTTNTTIISDPDNEYTIRIHAASANAIITHDYTNELYKHVMNALERFAR